MRSTKIWVILAAYKILLESDAIEVSCQVTGFLFLVVMCSHLLPYMAILNEIPLSPETKRGWVTISAHLPSCSECCRDFEHL